MVTEDIIHNGKKVGVRIGNVYMSHRKQSKHLYRGGLPTVQAAKKSGTAAWGIDHELVKLLKMSGIKVVAIHDAETKKAYWMSIVRLERDGSYLDFGHGLQKFMPVNSWKMSDIDKFMQIITSLEV